MHLVSPFILANKVNVACGVSSVELSYCAIRDKALLVRLGGTYTYGFGWVVPRVPTLLYKL
jgi:hypothetical protein